MYKNPKNTKQEIKLWAFYLLDIGIVGGMLILATYVLKVIPLSGAMTFFYYALSAAFGIFLCAKTSNHPIDRNFNMLIYLFRMDRNKYHAIDTKDFEYRKDGQV